MSITISLAKDDVINFLKSKLSIDEKILDKFNEEDIDGESLILLNREFFKDLNLKDILVQNKILSYAEKDILKINDNIKHNDLYKNIYTDDLNNLWKSLDDKLKQLKLGQQLKYIKYLLIRDRPPKKENINDLSKYLVKTLLCEKPIIDQIIENIDGLISLSKEELFIQCQEEYKLTKIQIFILKIIIELIKRNNFKSLEKENNISQMDITKDESNTPNKENEENIIINKKNEKTNYKIMNLSNIKNSTSDKYSIYSVIEIFKYDTSQDEITTGLINPKNEYEKICADFNINCQNECTFIDYDEAKKLKLTSFMLWGSKESLYLFFKNNNIKKAFDYFYQKKENERKSGIYLCINMQIKICFLIIWPGDFSYEYSNIDEPNDNILLTLIRYGFSLSSNSILCLTKNEIDDFDFDGYKIFENKDSAGFETERYKYKVDENNIKSFGLGEKKSLIKRLNEEDCFNKKITNPKINHNCLLINEKKQLDNNIIPIRTENFYKFIEDHSKDDIYFDRTFEIEINDFYLLIKDNNCYLSEKNKDKLLYIYNLLIDILEERLNKKIDDLFKPMNDDLFNNNILENIFKCKFCKKEEEKELYFSDLKNGVIFHENCYKNYKNRNRRYFNFQKITKELFLECEKYSRYQDWKKSTIENAGVLKDFIKEYFEKCEKKFLSLPKGYNFDKKNLLRIEQNVLVEEIKELKKIAFDYFSTEENSEHFMREEYTEYKNLQNLDKVEQNRKYEEWMNKWKVKINNYFKNNKNKIKKWIKLKSVEEKNINSNEKDIVLNYELNEIDSNIVTCLYEIKPIKDKVELDLSYSKELGKINEIENYYPDEKKGLIIYKKDDNFKIKFKGNNIKEFKGLYDYDSISGTLILYKEEKEIEQKIIGIYYSDGNCKTLYCNDIIPDNSIVNKIKLIPCVPEYKRQSFLAFIDKGIQIFNIQDKTTYPKAIDLSKEFNYNSFDEFQFIIYLDFLLILKYNNDLNEWKGKVFSLCQEDESLFEMITEVSLDSPKDSQFSFALMNEKKYLFSLNIYEKDLLINYWEIDSKLSGISFESQTKGKKQNSIKDIPFGNCVVNYFYHCFEKYPLIGALQYYLKKYENNNLELGFFVEKDYLNRINDIKIYLKELKKICEKKIYLLKI